MASERDVAEIVAIISAAYPNFNPTKHTVEVYYQTLKDIPTDLLRSATLQAISENGRKFAPSVGELRGTVADIQRAVSGTPTSYQAWQEVQRQMVETGSYGEPEWSHPLVAETVRVLGWRNLCLSEHQVADRARVVQAYEQLSRRYEIEAMMLPEVLSYIEANGGKLLAPAEQVKVLADRLGVQ